MNEKGEKQLGKIASQIYLYAYPKRKSRYQIAKKIYGYDHHIIADTIKNEELVKRNYIEYEEIKDEKGRVTNHFAFSKIDPIMIRIEKSPIGSKLKDYDKHVIGKILNSQGFRKIVDEDIKKSKYEPRDSVQHILLLFEIWTIISGKFRPILQKIKHWGIRTNFKDEKDYDQYFEKIKPSVKIAMPIVSKSITRKKEMKEFLMELENVVELFIPDNVMQKLKPGISSIGILYSTYDRAMNKIPKHLKKAEELLDRKGKKIAAEVAKKLAVE